MIVAIFRQSGVVRSETGQQRLLAGSPVSASHAGHANLLILVYALAVKTGWVTLKWAAGDGPVVCQSAFVLRRERPQHDLDVSEQKSICICRAQAGTWFETSTPV